MKAKLMHFKSNWTLRLNNIIQHNGTEAMSKLMDSNWDLKFTFNQWTMHWRQCSWCGLSRFGWNNRKLDPRSMKHCKDIDTNQSGNQSNFVYSCYKAGHHTHTHTHTNTHNTQYLIHTIVHHLSKLSHEWAEFVTSFICTSSPQTI